MQTKRGDLQGHAAGETLWPVIAVFGGVKGGSLAPAATRSLDGKTYYGVRLRDLVTTSGFGSSTHSHFGKLN